MSYARLGRFLFWIFVQSFTLSADELISIYDYESSDILELVLKNESEGREVFTFRNGDADISLVLVRKEAKKRSLILCSSSIVIEYCNVYIQGSEKKQTMRPYTMRMRDAKFDSNGDIVVSNDIVEQAIAAVFDFHSSDKIKLEAKIGFEGPNPFVKFECVIVDDGLFSVESKWSD